MRGDRMRILERMVGALIGLGVVMWLAIALSIAVATYYLWSD